MRAKILSAALVKYGLGEQWSKVYEAVNVPNPLSGIGKEIKIAFGTDVRFVAPTASEFHAFNGARVPATPKSIYINAKAGINPVAIIGHELYHSLEKDRPLQGKLLLFFKIVDSKN